MILKACDEEEAKRVAANRAQYTKAVAMDAKSNQLFTKALDSLTLDSVGEKQQIFLPIIIKADVVGSIEAIRSSLQHLNDSDQHHFAKITIVQDGVGDVTASDVNTAAATKAAIFAFNVAATSTVAELARGQNVELSYYSVLYDLLDNMKALLHRSLSPPLDGKIIGSATVRKVFKLGKAGKIAGCEVTEGTIFAAEKVRVVRDGKTVVYDGVMNSLKIVKESVLEVQSGSECGIGLKDFHNILEGDVIQSYQL
jgi:translation initiation factor IF-2